jgi:hypothetical protein
MENGDKNKIASREILRDATSFLVFQLNDS